MKLSKHDQWHIMNVYTCLSIFKWFSALLLNLGPVLKLLHYTSLTVSISHLHRKQAVNHAFASVLIVTLPSQSQSEFDNDVNHKNCGSQVRGHMFAFQLATVGSLVCKLGNENNSPALMKRKASVSQHMHELVSISRGSNLKTDSVLQLNGFQQHKFQRVWRRPSSSASQNKFNHENQMSQRWDSLSTATVIINLLLTALQ